MSNEMPDPITLDNITEEYVRDLFERTLALKDGGANPNYERAVLYLIASGLADNVKQIAAAVQGGEVANQAILRERRRALIQ